MTTATAPLPAAPPRPKPPQVNFDGISTRLKEGKRHVLWGYRFRNGKWTKPPLMFPNSEASVDDPRTWRTFDSARQILLADAQRNGSHKYDGLGFVFTREDNLCGLDLDDCRNPDTGELHPEAAKIVDDFATYAEISPSGRGVKLIFEGSLPTEGTGTRRKSPWWAGAIETYQHGRYFTLTGQRLPGTPDTITDCQAKISSLWAIITAPKPKPAAAANGTDYAPPSADVTDEKILAKIRASKQGAKFEALFSGDLSAYRNDHSAGDQGLCNYLAGWCNKDKERIDRLFRQSALMSPKWDEVHYSSGETYGEHTIQNAIDGCTWTYDWSKADRKRKKKKRPVIVSTANHAAPDQAAAADSKDAEEGDGLPSILAADGQTDIANAQRFAYLHGEDVRYCEGMKAWLDWDGKRWAIDDIRQIDTRARGVPAYLWKSVGELMRRMDGDELKDAIRFATNSSNDRGINAMLRQARSQPGIPIRATELDRDEWLLCCANGTLDLRTGELRTHDRGDLITKLCPTPYDPQATAPLWESFLNRIMAGNTRLITFLQRAAGYSLTGSVCEELLFFCYGKGRNGKSKFLGAIQNALGADFCMEAPHDLLMATKDKKHSTELTDLKGKRFVTAIENEDGNRLAEALVKKLTGGDRIRARRVHENCSEFSPTHKMWLAANHKPVIRGSDDAIWERLRVIPFTVFVPAEERIKDLDKRLAAEAAGILAWCVRGCLDWQRPVAEGGGLTQPPEVTKATEDYRKGEDTVARFVEECCIIDPRAKVKLSLLREAYHAWADDQGVAAVSGRRFGEWLGNHGFVGHTSNGTWYDGIGLKQTKPAT